MYCISDWCGYASVACTYGVIVFATSVVMQFKLNYWESSVDRNVALVYCTLLALAVVSHLRAMLTPPGRE